MDKWQEKYQDHWDKYSFKREKAVKALFSSLGHHLERFGYMAEGVDSGKPRIAGEPDYKVVGDNRYVEVTGTHISIGADQPIWIRPDKVEYAFNNLDKRIIAVHVLDHLDLFRWIPIKKCREYPVETRLGNEKYHIIPANVWKTIKKGEKNG